MTTSASMIPPLPPNPLRKGLVDDRTRDACAVVIFGASGDLTRRKLMPALYNLAAGNSLPSGFAVLGVARRDKTDESFRAEMKQGVAEFSRTKPIDPSTWAAFERGIGYVRGSASDAATYEALRARLEQADKERGAGQNRLFYLAVPPSEFGPIVEGLRASKLVAPGGAAASARSGGPWSRVVFEKPFGHDLASAVSLNDLVATAFDESQVFRIDHYLGKETVQNLLVFRFANSLFEPVWGREHVDHVQITVAEEIGVETRGKFYERTGVTRDIVENHLMQLLCLTAMEPPISLSADAVRDEKVKVLRSLRALQPNEIARDVVRGQYARGIVRGEDVNGYRSEPDVAADSRVETYVAMRVQIDNWRWSGVPFYVRAGKRMARRVTEIAVVFRSAPHALFSARQGGIAPNVLSLRIQPDEGIALRFISKEPGQQTILRDVAMDFRYGATFGSNTPEAYERLLLDAMRGDATLFTRRDEVEQQWAYIEPVMRAWDTDGATPRFYPAGSWGPEQADELLSRDGRQWRKP
ncbi:MAG TPA: glucose-6-phosphate dehydrogenase [Polyangiaceae bacterium]|jgi:glucose-6-phosphate 1-dehydrogenase|nr:glucose-6-phosphate dehydrogenase [Polyangiaceae bacterium]